MLSRTTYFRLSLDLFLVFSFPPFLSFVVEVVFDLLVDLLVSSVENIEPLSLYSKVRYMV